MIVRTKEQTGGPNVRELAMHNLKDRRRGEGEMVTGSKGEML